MFARSSLRVVMNGVGGGAFTASCRSGSLLVSRGVFLRSIASLVVAEHSNGTLNGATLHAVSAASQITPKVSVLVAGQDDECDSVAQELQNVAHVDKILVARNKAYAHNLPEVLEPLVSTTVSQSCDEFTHVLCTATAFGKNFIPRVAASLDVSPIADITNIVDSETFVRLIYAGNAVQTVRSTDSVKLITVRPIAFERAEMQSNGAEIVDAPAVDESILASKQALSNWVTEELSKGDRPELASASIVVAGGRGMGSGENFSLLETLADKLDAAVGASRAAVDAGFVSNDLQVGQTGKVVAPDLYIAVGISGAIQHLAGMKDSKVIVCINKDEEAPIFHVSDYGLKDDLFQAVPSLTTKLA